jgi:hypothetical protein
MLPRSHVDLDAFSSESSLLISYRTLDTSTLLISKASKSHHARKTTTDGKFSAS